MTGRTTDTAHVRVVASPRLLTVEMRRQGTCARS
jgi:hypothetical protein